MPYILQKCCLRRLQSGLTVSSASNRYKASSGRFKCNCWSVGWSVHYQQPQYKETVHLSKNHIYIYNSLSDKSRLFLIHITQYRIKRYISELYPIQYVFSIGIYSLLIVFVYLLITSCMHRCQQVVTLFSLVPNGSSQIS